MQVSFRTLNSRYRSGLALVLCANTLAMAAGPIELLHADRVRLVAGAGGRTTIWEGGVLAEHEGAELRCDRARLERGGGAFMATGNVRFRSDDGLLECDRATYDRDSRRLNAKGNVVWDGPSATIRSRELIHWRDRHSSVATGDPQLTLARAWFGDSATEAAPICVTADSLWVLEVEGKETHRALGGVEIQIDDVSAAAERADFDREEGRLLLVGGEPMARRGEGEMSGERIVVRLVGGEVAAIDAVTGARFRELHLPATEVPVWDEIEGDSLRLAFVAGEADAVDAHGDASALFFPEDGPAVWNRVEGEAIHIELEQDRARSVSVAGSAEGVYGFPGELGGGG